MTWQWPVGIVSFILFIWGILPYVTGRIRNIGVWVSAAVGVSGIICAACGKTLVQTVICLWNSGKAAQIVLCVLGALLTMLLLLFFGVSLLLLISANRTSVVKEGTLLVPGAKLYDDRLSRSLLQRIQAAAAYLQAHPDTPCVVSGGQGADEPRTEAVAMRNCLVEMGIDGKRIYMEDASVNTFENMQFSRKVIDANGLSTDIIIVTQGFHQYRCGEYAKRAGLNPVSAVTCRTRPHLLLCYWVREFAGVCRMWFLGY